MSSSSSWRFQQPTFDYDNVSSDEEEGPVATSAFKSKNNSKLRRRIVHDERENDENAVPNVEVVDLCESSSEEDDDDDDLRDDDYVLQQDEEVRAAQKESLRHCAQQHGGSTYDKEGDEEDDDAIECWQEQQKPQPSQSQEVMDLMKSHSRSSVKKNHSSPPSQPRVPSTTTNTSSRPWETGTSSQRDRLRQAVASPGLLQQASRDLWYRTNSAVAMPTRNDLSGGSGAGVGNVVLHRRSHDTDHDEPPPAAAAERTKTTTKRAAAKKTTTAKKAAGGKKKGGWWGGKRRFRRKNGSNARTNNNPRTVAKDPWAPGYQHRTDVAGQRHDPDLQHVGGGAIRF
jgi:hypothetical protein